jgi:polysaccharide biosynthesis transport protein
MIHSPVQLPALHMSLVKQRPPVSVMNTVISSLGSPSKPRVSGTNIAGLGATLWQRLPSIAAITLTSFAASVLYLLMTPPTYMASTTLFIDPRPKKIVSEDTTQSGLGTDLALLESQVSIIRSDTVLSRVVEKLQLADDPEFAPPPGNGLGTKIKGLFGVKPVTLEPAAQALTNLASRVTVKRAQKTYVVEIEATSSQPVKASRITQAIVDAYLADQTSAKTDEAQRANALIDGRLGELREQVRLAETRVDTFRKDNSILTSEGGTVGEQQLTRLNSELMTARAQAAEAKARLTEVTLAAKSRNPDVITDPAKTGLLQRLREQLAQVARRDASLSSQLMPRHPVLIDIRAQMAEIQGQISTELSRLAANAKADSQVAESREKELVRALDAAKQEVGRTNTAQIKQRELEQEVAASRELMRIFLARSKETDEQQKISTPDARMISPPSVPTRASKPVPALILGLGLLGGLAAGVARALLLDLADTSVKTAQEVEHRTGLRTLAALPTLKPRARPGVIKAAGGVIGRVASTALTPFRPQTNGIAHLIEASQFGPFALALSRPFGRGELGYRQAVTGLLNQIHAFGGSKKPHVVMLTSPLAQAGTSTAAFSLAYASATLGDRVLLIDAASRATGLSDALCPTLPTDKVITLDNVADLKLITVRDPVSGLAFLPIGLANLPGLRNAQRQRLQHGLRLITASYDLVVIDGGAVLEDESAAILQPLAHQIMIVGQAGTTTGPLLADAAQQLDRARDRLSGVVLTQTPATLQ